MKILSPLVTALCLATLGIVHAKDRPPSPKDPETPEQNDARMAWWRDAKFGLFIHWGLYAIPADGEWHMRNKMMPLADYKKYTTEFNPIKFNAEEWASIAQEAGMKYLVYTTKHHDGFAMYHSSASDYNIYDATPFKRDPLQELSLACPKHDIKLGTYYSVIADWGHPGGGAGCEKWDEAQKGDIEEYIDKISIPQVKELLTNYGPIAVMWFDSDGAKPPDPAQAGAKYASVLKLQPDLIVRGGAGSYPGDFDSRESYIPVRAPKKNWELCYTANGAWGYTKTPARPLNKILPTLIEAWAKGGNVLLNVGPDREGSLPTDSVNLLKQIGAWLKINGEAVYGSKQGPFDYLPWGYSSIKGDILYLFVLQWPKDGALRIPTTTPITKAFLLADPSKTLASQKIGNFTELKLPEKSPDPIASVIACQMNGDVPPYHPISLASQVTASENTNAAPSIMRGGMWGMESPTGWLQMDLGKPETFSTLRLTTPPCKAATRDALTCTKGSRVIFEIKNGDDWKTIFEDDLPMNGKNREGRLIREFPPVLAQVVRVRFIAGTPEAGNSPKIRIGSVELF